VRRRGVTFSHHRNGLPHDNFFFSRVNAMTKIAICIVIFAACGGVGPPGAPGSQGETGGSGSAGVDALVTSSVEPPGAHCPAGGVKLEFGRDQDHSTTLDPGEINPALTRYICNGAAGGQGTNGAPGQSVTVDTVPPGDPNCPAGGVKFTSSNGSAFACNGQQGATGEPGPTNIASCPSGYTTIPRTNSTLCVQRIVSPQTWLGATDLCNNNAGALLCTYQQMRRACLSSVSLVADSWLADRMGDDAALIVNSSDCSNFDGVASSLFVHSAAYCCLEWMKY
jgi:hypothetical protein